MHDRLVGVPPAAAVLDQMAGLITADPVNGPLLAAEMAMENNGLPRNPFYNTTLRNFVMPWSNEAQSSFGDMNDYVLTVIGMIRDGVDFSSVLSADLVYVYGGGNAGVDPYSHTDNEHYRDIDRLAIDISDPLEVISSSQSNVTGANDLPPAATAGVQTTRAGAEAFFSAGTNRRMLRFSLMNYLCHDLEDVHDTSRTPDRIRRDVSRNPGGDSSIFLNNCVGCHAGMDPLAQAYAFYDFDGQIIYSASGPGNPNGTVQEKNNINANAFDLGYEIQNPNADRWDNYWREGPNSALGWFGPGSGNGAKSLGTELASSRAFSECQVKKVFQAVCLHGPTSAADLTEIQRISDALEVNQPQAPFNDPTFAGSYNMKRVFAEVANYCKGP
ncbi:MAG: hypothetical protein JSW10_09700 [Pseudomonadota bacterium]|nr:MAG: hypothetical protein JSW10_09700 [Pseudomonadota bacterium]